MKEKIVSMLKDIESDYNVKILFAVESGSRLWRMESKESDYDIRFVFIRPLSEYLKINTHGEVINKQLKEFDLVGFDIYKFLKLLNNSNPSIIEWLNSDIVYLKTDSFKEVLKDYINKNFNTNSLFYHYKSMCKQNYLKYIKSSKLITYKKYLYSMRGLINSLWVVNYNTIPPINFKETIINQDYLPKNVKNKLLEIIEIKKGLKENHVENNIILFDSFIEEFLKKDYEVKKLKRIDINFFNELISKLLLK